MGLTHPVYIKTKYEKVLRKEADNREVTISYIIQEAVEEKYKEKVEGKR